MRVKKLCLFGANAVVIAVLAICYVQLLVFVLAQLAFYLPPAISSLGKMAHTAASILAATLVVFVPNALITRQNMLRLGQACGITTFVWFYVIRADNQSTIVLIFSSFLYLHSAFAVFALTLWPVALGTYLNRKQPVRGFLTLCDVG